MYQLLMFSIRPHIYITAQEDIKCSLRVTFSAITVIVKVRFFYLSILYVLKTYILLNSPFHVNSIILLHYKLKTSERTNDKSINLPANQYKLFLRNGLLFFITEQKLFFCCLGFDRVQRLEPHHLQKLVYKARVVCAHRQSPKASQSERSTNEPSTQRQAIRTWRWNLMAFKVICFWKTFAGLSYWSNNYNDSMHQALLHFIQSREATRTDLCLSCK